MRSSPTVRRLASYVAGGLMLVGWAAACSAAPTDFVREGERYLESDEMARAAGYRLMAARCETPASVAVGTVYRCRATDERGYSWVFAVEITGSQELTVQDVAPAPPVTADG
jgi:hypothetical protein